MSIPEEIPVALEEPESDVGPAASALEVSRWALEMLRGIDDAELTPLEQREKARLIARTGYLIDSLEWRKYRRGGS